MIAFAIIVSTLIASVAYVYPKIVALQIQENLVKLQIDAMSETANASGQTEIDWEQMSNGPYA